jgi:antitoxin ParD1/3/4
VYSRYHLVMKQSPTESGRLRTGGEPLAIDEALARGIADADAGRAKPAEEVFARLMSKYLALVDQSAK